MTEQALGWESEVAWRSRGLWSDAWRRLRRNRAAVAGLVFVCLVGVVAVLAGQLAPHHFSEQQLTHAWEGPSRSFPLGTDGLGRDVLSRVLYGTRISISVALVAELLMISIGVPVGMISGYVGGWLDSILMRLVDTLFAFPTLLLIIVLSTFLKGSLTEESSGFAGVLFQMQSATGGLMGIFIALGLTWWLVEARLMRGMVMSVKQREYVLAAHAMGASDLRIMLHHLLPNCIAPMIVAATLGVPIAILTEAGISFLGLGVDPPIPSWGLMVADGTQALRSYPYLVIAPSFAISLTMLAFNFLGDGLRDALDPTTRDIGKP